MTLAELTAMKAWHVAHREGRPLEFHSCDAILTLWLIGWVGTPGCWLLSDGWTTLACASLVLVPETYLRWRTRLHQRGRLRCDWLDAVRGSAAASAEPPSHHA